MPVTIRHIASVAGVSRGTVDRVLHNRPGVKPEIAAHVRKIAEELGFEPNRAGRMLAAKKQPLKIGCFLPSIGNPFFADVVAGFRQAETELADFGVSVLLREVQGYSVKTHMQAIRSLLEEGCQALCVSTVDMPEMRDFLNRIIDKGVPIIAVNTDLTDTRRLCYVGCNYLQAGSTVAGLLALTLPAQVNLLIVTGSLLMKGHNERIQGFSRTLRQKNLEYRLVDAVEAFDNDERAYEMTRSALRDHPEINCIYIVAAGVSGVCRAVQQEGSRLMVLSHDEIESTRWLVQDGVIAFTVGQQPFEQGQRSVEMMFDYFVGGKKTRPRDFITDTVIIIKENLS